MKRDGQLELEDVGHQAAEVAFPRPPLAVACPKCGAPARQQCVLLEDGVAIGFASSTHRDRYRAAGFVATP